MQDRLAKRPDILDRRREVAEHPFGSIKQWMNQGAFLMRGLENVRGEFSLTALAYNLRRGLNLWSGSRICWRPWRSEGHLLPTYLRAQDEAGALAGRI